MSNSVQLPFKPRLVLCNKCSDVIQEGVGPAIFGLCMPCYKSEQQRFRRQEIEMKRKKSRRLRSPDGGLGDPFRGFGEDDEE